MTDIVHQLAKKIWDYHHMHQTVEKADAIFVLCSHDLRVADYAVNLFRDEFAPILIFSGGIAHKGDLVETPWNEPEAKVFSQRALQLGIPKEKILIEDKAQNCGENVLFTDKLLKENNLHLNSFIAVQKPYMERRTYATIKKHWPSKKILVTSPPIDFDTYPTQTISMEDVINIMVGDLHRIKIYPEKGFQVTQEIPDDVWAAYEALLQLGYTKHLLKP